MKLDKRLLQQARTARLYLVITVGLGLLAGVATILQALYLSRVITLVFLEGWSLDEVGSLLLILLLVIVARAGLAGVREVVAYQAAGRIKARLRERLFAHLLALGPAYTSGERTGELANTAVEGVESLEAYFSQYLPNLALAALVPLTVLVFVFPVDLLSGLVFLLTAPLIPLFMILIGKLAEARTRQQWESLGWMSAHFLDVLQGLTTLKLFGRSQAQIGILRRVSDHFRRTTLGVLRVAFLSALALELLATVSTALVAVEIGLRLLYGALSFEQAFFVLILAPEFYLPLRNLGTGFHAGLSAVAAAQRVFEVLETPVGRDTEMRCAPRPSVSPSPYVRFRDVHYAYDDGRRPALRGVSLEIARGEKVALVGPSGAGKSTVAHLLMGFLEPDQGEILVEGEPLHGLSLEDWRGQLAWVPQNPYLFHATVADNLRLARPQASLEQLVEAARLAHAHEFIQGLPRGYDTLIGERGERLSGGQAQRLALARAFLKDAPFLILDEATSNLDVELGAQVQESLDRLMEGRSVLVIAHRLSTVHRADRIVVLVEGRVAEIGSHQELLSLGGFYHRLVGAHGDKGHPRAAGVAAPCVGARGVVRPHGEPGNGVGTSLDVPSGVSTGMVRLREGEAPAEPPLAPPGGSAGASPSRREPGPPGAVAPSPPCCEPCLSTAHEGEAGDRTPDAPTGRQTLSRLLQLMAPFKGGMALAALLGFATLGSGIGLLATSAFLLATAALHPSVAELAVPIVGVRFFGLSRAVFRYLERYVSHNVTFHLLARLRVWFYQALEPQAPAQLMRHRGGDLLSRVVADVETLQHFYARVIAPPLVALLVGLLMAIFLGSFDATLASILMAFLLLSGVAVPLLTQRLSQRLGQRMTRLRAELNVHLVDGLQGMADLVAFGQGQRQLDRVRALGRDWVGDQERMARITGLHSGLSSLLANLGMWAVLVAAIPLVAEGSLAGVYLPVLALAALASFEAVTPLPAAFQQLGSSLEAARRLFGIVEGGQEARDGETGRGHARGHVHGGDGGTWRGEPSPRPSPLGRGSLLPPLGPRDYGLVVESLRFRYGPREPLALDGVSFELPEGRSLAIVGPSGAGKSTLVHLLLRFWDYQEGQISLGGWDLRRYDPEELRRRLAVVPQRTHLFNGTLRENLLIARPEATEEQLVRAARQAQLHPFVETLPQGYDTRIGERGLRLSGGERQRLALARALLKDAPLLLLDEPTANLDSLSEQEVMKAIHAQRQGRTLLIITHRLAGLEAADQILVLEQGKVAGQGRHRELLERDGLYRRTWELQHELLPV